MNAVEVVLLVQKLKPLHVPRDMARVRHDLEVFHRSDEAALLLVEISLVGERQSGARLLEHIERIFRWRFALGMEMSLQRIGRLRLRLRVCGAVIQHQMSGDGEGCSDRGKGLDEFASC